MLSAMLHSDVKNLILFLIALLAAPASQAEPQFPENPVAVVEIGAHGAPIRSMSTDQAERWIVTGSDDKSIRIWEAATGQLISTLRVPLGPRKLGQIFSVAISPDGQWIAAGGLTGTLGDDHRIYILDRASGTQIHVIEDLPDMAIDLTISADGSRLAASLWGAHGVRLYETSGWTEIRRDSDYGDSSYSIDIAKDGRLIATSDDGDLRLYDAALNLVLRKQGDSGRYPFTARFSPDGEEIAVGYDDVPVVEILSAADLSHLAFTDTLQVETSSLFKAVWSQDGSRLCAAGRSLTGDENPVICWDDAGRGPMQVVDAGATDTVVDLTFLKGGDLLVSAHDSLVARLDPAGQVDWAVRGEKADFRGQRETDGRSLRVSATGDVVEFGFLTWGEDRAVLDLSAGEFSPEALPWHKLAPALETGMDIENWINTTEPTLNDRLLDLEPFETARSIAIVPGQQRFLLGTDYSLRAFDATGRQIWGTKQDTVTWAVTVAQARQVAVVGMGDGTLRWFTVEDGRELLRAFVHPDGRWVAWMPEGFFTASANGSSLLQYIINRGADRLPEVVAVEQLAEHYFRPDLIAARLAGDEEVIAAAVAALGPVDDLLRKRQAPRITLVGPEHVDHNRIDFESEIRIEGPDQQDLELVYIVNGVRIARPGARAARRDRRSVVLTQPLTLDPTLPGEVCNRIEVYAETADGALRSPSVTQTVCIDDPRYRPPKLYALVIGIDDYFDSSLGLMWARDDAERVGKMLESQGRGLYQQIKVVPLLDEDATKAKIKETFETLAREVQPSDVFVLYIAGHGFATDGRYHFVPQEARFTNSDALREASIAEEQIIEFLAGINTTKSLIILDTCESGAFSPVGTSQLALAQTRGAKTKFAIDRLMRQSGRAVLAASSARQEALEGYQGHGLFTWVLLKAVAESDKRFGNGNELVDIGELNSYLSEEVPKLSKQVFGRAQVPMGTVSGKLEFIFAKDAE
ncbi:caspase family protein [Pelagibius marinus]|uniref:caspase family protein n=1 Tax=Pelagibius marinus TaxID=2762760 RepID=UPI0018722784|nr:caspase family protein [Pelagibius marinus]